jgi:molybdenum cofactor cytidylyltransferase
MGLNKLSLPWGRRTVFEHCLYTFLRSKVEEVVIVINPWMKEMVHSFKDQKVKIVTNPYYKRGMSSSIRRGLQAIDPGSHGILIALGDQPFLKTKTINALIHTFEMRKERIIIPTYRGIEGHPILFSRRFKKEFMKIKGDVGGRFIIRRFSKDVWKVPVRSEGVVKDIDIWEDYNKWVKIK